MRDLKAIQNKFADCIPGVRPITLENIKDIQEVIERCLRGENFIKGLNIELAAERDRRAKAEAEVERLKEELDELKRFYDKVCEGHYDEVAKLQTENAKLRKVVDIAWNVVETRGMSDVLLSELAGRLADWGTWKEGER